MDQRYTWNQKKLLKLIIEGQDLLFMDNLFFIFVI